MRRRNRREGILLLTVVGLLGQYLAAAEPSEPSATLVRVNHRAITQADLETAYLVRGVPPDRQSALRKPLLERLIEEQLIASFLEQRRVKPNDEMLERQVDQLLSLIHRRGEDPDQLLARLGLNQTQVRQHLSLPLAWDTYAREVITPAKINSYFQSHRRELDGTQLRARHIVLKVPADAPAAAWNQATAKLEAARREIQSGQQSFVDAARDLSEGPSGDKGGDVGFFAFRGTMSPAFADAAFLLNPGELSPPVRTNVGVHLIEVTEERPGQLSLEDVRETVLDRLAAQLWDEQVAAARAKASIVWTQTDDAKDSR